MAPKTPKDSKNLQVPTDPTPTDSSAPGAVPVDSGQGEDLQSFLEKNASELNNIAIPRNTILNPNQVDEVLEIFSKKHELTTNQSKVVITTLFQAGGTNKSCDGNLEVTAFGKKIKLASLRKSLAECKLKGCERKLARALANEIAMIAKKLSIPGNLAIKAQNLKGSELITMDIQIWLSDFQEKNTSCPLEARKLITEVFQTRKNTAVKKK
jgi:hypothetical protein